MKRTRPPALTRFLRPPVLAALAALAVALAALPHRHWTERRLAAAAASVPASPPVPAAAVPPPLHLPGPASVPLCLAALLECARTSGLTAVRAATSRARAVPHLGDRFRVVEVTLQAAGPFAAVSRFARALEGFPGTVLKEACLEPGPADQVALRCTVELVLSLPRPANAPREEVP